MSIAEKIMSDFNSYAKAEENIFALMSHEVQEINRYIEEAALPCHFKDSGQGDIKFIFNDQEIASLSIYPSFKGIELVIRSKRESENGAFGKREILPHHSNDIMPTIINWMCNELYTAFKNRDILKLVKAIHVPEPK